MARKAVKQLLTKTNTHPDEVDCVIVATTTPDYKFPTVSSIVVGKCGMHNAHCIDMAAACCGFLYAMDAAAAMIESGRYKKVVVCGADKMSSIVDYTDRATCPIFGDGAGAVMVEPSTEDLGWKDSLLRADGLGFPYLHLIAGGSAVPSSHYTIDHKMQYIHQEGRAVYKHAVTNMSDVSVKVAERNGLDGESINWVLPHQANLRIIEAVVNRLQIPMERVMVNIGRYGNTSAACMPHGLREATQEGRQYHPHRLWSRIHLGCCLYEVGIRRIRRGLCSSAPPSRHYMEEKQNCPLEKNNFLQLCTKPDS